MGRSRPATGASAFCALCAFSLAVPLPALAQRTVQPNIVLILADDLGYGDLGSYGQTRIRTPNLDRMAGAGMRFTNFYAGGPTCSPSRDALVTGRHTGHTRNRDDHHYPLHAEDRTVAEVLQGAGYATGLVGKWGLGGVGSEGHPNRKGFDYFFGYLDSTRAHNYWPDYLWENEEKIPLDNEVVRSTTSERATEQRTYAPKLLLEKALEFVEQHRTRPFFLFFAPNLVHANSEFVDGVTEGYLNLEYFRQDWPYAQRYYATMVSVLDIQVGRILDTLDSLGLGARTAVFFSSDNGPHDEGGLDPYFFSSSGGLRGYKKSMYEGGLRVPLIVRWPGHTPAGSVSDGVFAVWDFLPTAAAMAGSPLPEGVDGVSMLGALAGQPDEGHPFLYWERYKTRSQQVVRLGPWKVIRNGLDDEVEVYDLAADPTESENLSDRHPDVVAQAREVWEREHREWARVQLGTDWERTARTRLGWVEQRMDVIAPVTLGLVFALVSPFLLRRGA